MTLGDLTRKRALTMACGIALGLGACVHDEFPDRLKKGCSSEHECNELLGEALYRLNDCAGFMVGNKIRRNWTRAKQKCHYEWVDCAVALNKAQQWAKWANANQIGGPGKHYGYQLQFIYE